MARRVITLAAMSSKLHTNCRKVTCQPYIRDDDQERCAVPDDKVPWSSSWLTYDPDDYTMDHVLKGPVWADPPR